ncbi:MAG: FMN-dependent NADH-azoreductase [Burkholderiales bacterium]
MAKLLYIEASPRKDRSHSIRVARTFLDAYLAAHQRDAVETLDLWDTVLPPFNGDTIAAKYAVIHGESFTSAQASAWDGVKAVFNRFNNADKYLFSVPMWNFGVPYVFKHYIDVITQPGLAWSWSPDQGYKGLLSGKRAALACSSGGAYHPGSGAEAMDFQKPYLETWLRFIGIADIQTIAIAPTIADTDTVDAAKQKALMDASEIARKF